VAACLIKDSRAFDDSTTDEETTVKLRRGRLTADGRGVKAWAWVDGAYKGAKYVGTGANTMSVWDPLGNVAGGHSVGLMVCSVDGNDDSTALWCDSHTVTIDG
jgi:hypothetical protein